MASVQIYTPETNAPFVQICSYNWCQFAKICVLINLYKTVVKVPNCNNICKKFSNLLLHKR